MNFGDEILHIRMHDKPYPPGRAMNQIMSNLHQLAR